MRQFKLMWPCLLVSLILFYGCPMVARALHKDLMLIVVLTPCLCCAIGFIYTYLEKISIVLPVISVILAMPAIYLFYTTTAVIYPFLFGLCVLIGEVMGRLIKEIPAT